MLNHKSLFSATSLTVCALIDFPGSVTSNRNSLEYLNLTMASQQRVLARESIKSVMAECEVTLQKLGQAEQKLCGPEHTRVENEVNAGYSIVFNYCIWLKQRAINTLRIGYKVQQAIANLHRLDATHGANQSINGVKQSLACSKDAFTEAVLTLDMLLKNKNWSPDLKTQGLLLNDLAKFLLAADDHNIVLIDENWTELTWLKKHYLSNSIQERECIAIKLLKKSTEISGNPEAGYSFEALGYYYANTNSINFNAKKAIFHLTQAQKIYRSHQIPAIEKVDKSLQKLNLTSLVGYLSPLF